MEKEEEVGVQRRASVARFAHLSSFLSHLLAIINLKEEGFHTLDYSSASCLTLITFCVPKVGFFPNPLFFPSIY